MEKKNNSYFVVTLPTGELSAWRDSSGTRSNIRNGFFNETLLDVQQASPEATTRDKAIRDYIDAGHYQTILTQSYKNPVLQEGVAKTVERYKLPEHVPEANRWRKAVPARYKSIIRAHKPRI